MFVTFFSLSLMQWNGWLAMFEKLFLFQHVSFAMGWMHGHVC